jgi:polyhydroxybutyrate depolymerase
MNLLPLLLTILLGADPLEPGDHIRKLDVDGRSRSFLVHVPPGCDPNRPAPVVLAYHGSSMNARMMATYSGLSKKADEAGFIVVYPNGTGPSKLIMTFDCGGLPELQGGKTRPDDVAFTARMLDDLETVLNIDRKRVFATGFSNGGMMCHRLAAELSDRIAAIAVVSGPIALEKFELRRPVPVLYFHGTDDTIVAWDGPDAATSAMFTFKPVEESIRTSVAANRCWPNPTVEEMPDLVDDGTTVTRHTYRPRPNGAEVTFYKINGGGHTWPGHGSLDRLLGHSSQDISANDLIWEFFEKYPMPEGDSRSLLARAVGPRIPLPVHITRRVVQDYRFASRRALFSGSRQFPASRSKTPNPAPNSQ